LILSTAGGSGTFGIAAGVANDTTNTVLMQLASAYTKTTSSWAVGTGNGGLDTGAIANSTWYHVFEIYRPDTGVVDIVFSLNTSPTLPTNYTLFRRIGSMKTDASAHWTAFTQVGDTFVWATSITDLSAANNAGARSAVTLTVPPGVQVTATFRASGGATGAGTILAIFTSLLETDQTTPSDLAMILNTQAAGSFERVTNTSAQIGFRTSSTNGTISIFTYGWKDSRGK
jgi:hypothetical protein